DRVLADGKIHRFRSGPEGDENGFYRVCVLPAHSGGDIGFGLVGCWKRGVKEKWCSREAGALAEPDRRAIRKLREDHRRAEDEAARAAAEKARSIWAASFPPDPSHPYLTRKGIGPRGLRQYKDALVVPVYQAGTITSLQFIAPDGTKRFLKKGDVEGGYASLAGRDAAKDRIVIAEGYATAASLHAATGLPVVVAFNAGNLVPVAKAIRAKYPDARIVIAADNDQWTVVRGEPVNVGLERARQAAVAVGTTVSTPAFSRNDPEKPTDWNDYAVRHGAAATREAFERAPDSAPAPDEGNLPPAPEYPVEMPIDYAHPPAFEDDWRTRLIPGKEVAEGHPFPFEGKSKTNAYLFLKHHDRFAGVLCYNEFTDAVMLARRPPWESGDFSPRSIRDDDFFMLAAHLEYCDISASKDTAADAAIRVAKENAINPPREFLSRLEWDRQPRLDTWLTYYLGADEQPAEYLALVGAKWLVGAVSRVFAPGCKFDSVLILEGSQGLGKSMALRSLATFGGQDFFLDSVGDIRSKDTLMTMQGKLIVEIAELASFRKSENEEIKAFITRQVDEYRPPYGRTVLKRPRFFVLAGSTNEIDEGYLTDDTGNRRYWPVKCKGIDAEAVERDAPQLWAEAVVRYRAGERTWLTGDEAVFSTREQKMRFMEDAWQERIGEIVRHEWTLRIDEVLGRLELKPKDINNMVKKRVKNSLRQLGWVETRRAGEGRVWRPAERARVAADA
ncbi:MAG TPA: VapE domain-containing protein, partial [Urbifossiella sp.]|nr:VapE domain-containing protein [Urbifossiella sp.]